MPRTVLERIEITSKSKRSVKDHFYDTIAAIDSFTAFIHRTLVPDCVFTALSIMVNWSPFVMLLDLVNMECIHQIQNGILKNSNINLHQIKTLMLSTMNYWIYYLIMFIFLRCALGLIEYFSDRNLTENEINNARTKSDLLTLVQKTYKSTVRIIRSQYHANIVLIGTSHLSHQSAQQVDKIINAIKPSAVVLELDEKRSKRLNAGNEENKMNKSYQTDLIHDLFKLHTLLDPITLFARLGTRCISYFSMPGFEFTTAARVARENNVKIVFGDQDISKTLASIRKATPLWVAMVINSVVFHTYVLPILFSFVRVFKSFVTLPITHTIFSIFVTFILWHMICIQLHLFIEVFTEQSKMLMGINRIGYVLRFFGKILPCISRILKKSDLKHTRDVTLIQNTVACAREFDSCDTIVAVVGLAHMNDMVKIYHMDYDSCDEESTDDRFCHL